MAPYVRSSSQTCKSSSRYFVSFFPSSRFAKCWYHGLPISCFYPINQIWFFKFFFDHEFLWHTAFPPVLVFRICTIIEAIHTAVFKNKHHIRRIQEHRKAQEVRVWNKVFFFFTYQMLIAQHCAITIFIFSGIYIALQNIF